VTASVRSASGTTGNALVYLHDTAGLNAAIDVPRVPSSSGWEVFQVHFLATSSEGMRVHLQFTGGAGAVYFDNVQVVQGWHEGFEGSGLGGWTPFGAGGSVSAVAAIEGAHSVQDSGSGGVFQDIVGLVPGQLYHVIGRAHSSSGATTQTMLWIHDTTGGRIGNSAAKTPSSIGWDAFETNFVAGANGAMRVHLLNLSGSGSIYWDDLEVLSGGAFTLETGDLGGWGVAGSVTAGPSSVIKATGAFSMSESGSSGLVYRDITGLDAGVPYRISVRARSSPGATGTILLWVHDTSGGNIVQSGPRLPSSAQWDSFTVNFLSTATSAVRIHLMYGGGAGTAYIDDVTVEKGWYSGFEEGLAGWNAFGPTSSVLTTAAAYSGQNSVAQSGSSGGVYRDIGGLAAGQKYRITARAHSTSPSALLWVHDAAGNNGVQDGPRPPTGTDWAEYGLTFVGTGTGTARIHLYDVGGSGTVYWDDVQLTPIAQ
jgi:hypothetical protein